MKHKNPSKANKVVALSTASLIACFICLPTNCKTQSTTPDVDNIQNENRLSISCSPSSGGTGTEIEIKISCVGNSNEIKAFGLEMTFDPAIFRYKSTGNGDLTGSWASVDGNETSSGKIIVGGFVGSGTPVVVGSNGNLAIIKLNVIYAGDNSGFTRQISINNYLDNIAGMNPMPNSATFTYIK